MAGGAVAAAVGGGSGEEATGGAAGGSGGGVELAPHAATSEAAIEASSGIRTGRTVHAVLGLV